MSEITGREPALSGAKRNIEYEFSLRLHGSVTDRPSHWVTFGPFESKEKAQAEAERIANQAWPSGWGWENGGNGIALHESRAGDVLAIQIYGLTGA